MFDAEKKGGRRQQPPQAALDAKVEVALISSRAIKRHQRLHVRVRHWSAVRAPRECRENSLRAGLLGHARRRMAEKNPAAARRVDGDRSVIWTADHDAVDRWLSEIQLVRRPREAALRWLLDAFRLDMLTQKRHADVASTGLHWDAHFEPVV